MAVDSTSAETAASMDTSSSYTARSLPEAPERRRGLRSDEDRVVLRVHLLEGNAGLGGQSRGPEVAVVDAPVHEDGLDGRALVELIVGVADHRVLRREAGGHLGVDHAAHDPDHADAPWLEEVVADQAVQLPVVPEVRAGHV